MPLDVVILDNDVLICEPVFGNAIVAVRPGNIPASGSMLVGGKKTAIKDDEKNVLIAACTYISPPYVVPGVGDITIELRSPQIANKADNSKPLILKGDTYKAIFTVTTPATIPPPSGSPDSTAEYIGQGVFIAPQRILKAD